MPHTACALSLPAPRVSYRLVDALVVLAVVSAAVLARVNLASSDALRARLVLVEVLRALRVSTLIQLRLHAHLQGEKAGPAAAAAATQAAGGDGQRAAGADDARWAAEADRCRRTKRGDHTARSRIASHVRSGTARARTGSSAVDMTESNGWDWGWVCAQAKARGSSSTGSSEATSARDHEDAECAAHMKMPQVIAFACSRGQRLVVSRRLRVVRRCRWARRPLSSARSQLAHRR